MNIFKTLYDNANLIKDSSTSRLVPVMRQDGKPSKCQKVEKKNDPFDKMRNLLEVKSSSGRQDVMPVNHPYSVR